MSPKFPTSGRFLQGLEAPGSASAELYDVGPGVDVIPPRYQKASILRMAPHRFRPTLPLSRLVVGRSEDLRRECRLGQYLRGLQATAKFTYKCLSELWKQESNHASF